MNNFEVQTLVGRDWENTWTEDETPVTFQTRKEAETALAEFLADMAEAVASGNMPEVTPCDQYRIVSTTAK
jgi:hypothetical protein